MELFDYPKPKWEKHIDNEQKKYGKRIAILETLVETLQEDINKKASNAKQYPVPNIKKPIEYKNKIYENITEALDIIGNLNNDLASARSMKEEIEANNTDLLKGLLGETKLKIDNREYNSKQAYELLKSSISNTHDFLKKYRALYETHLRYGSLLDSLDEYFNNTSPCADTRDKIRTVIYDLYNMEDDEETTKIEVSKEDLDKTLKKLEDNLAAFKETLDRLNNGNESKYKTFEDNLLKGYEKIIALAKEQRMPTQL